uniref:Uncharacterized protein n=1 Tax=Zea mays TaxID=4577 RepID=C4IZM7_MAIZE|nr:unknown [Zea mays]
MRASKQATLPCACDELDDRAEEQERAVEGQADVPPVPPEQPVQHLEPLDDMVPEVRLLPLLPGPVLHVENADEVRRPAAHQPVQELEQYAAQHPQLRERVGQGQEHLSHLVGRAAEPSVVGGAAVPEQAGEPRLGCARLLVLLHFHVPPDADRLRRSILVGDDDAAGL